MKDKDKINQFFVQRLGDDTPGDDGWNMPSDEIFNNAKPHFPKKEKKRRPLFFWINAGVIALLVCGVGLYSFFGNSDRSIEFISANNSESEIVKNVISNTNSEQNTTEIDEQKIVESNKEVLVENKKLNDVVKSTNTLNKKKVTPIKNSVLLNKTDASNNKLFSPENVSSIVNELTTAKNVTQTFLTNTNTEITSSNNKNAKVKTKTPAAFINENNLRINSAFPMLTKVHKWELISDSNVSAELGIDQMNSDKFASRKIQKWEIGLTYAGFLIPFNRIILRDSSKTQALSFDLKNRNFNIPITRRLNRRWSITSGYSFTAVDFDIKLKKQFIYNSNATEDKVETLVDEIIREGAIGGTIELNNQSQTVSLEFVNNLELEDGDIIDLNAKIPLRLKLHQIPLLVNFHLGSKKRNRKLEWILHAGPVLEYFEVKIPFFEMDAYEGTNLLTHSVEFEPLSEQRMSYGIMAGGGLKYYLNDHFNIGLNTKIDVFAIPAARYEVGLFYGFKPKKNNQNLMQY